MGAQWHLSERDNVGELTTSGANFARGGWGAKGITAAMMVAVEFGWRNGLVGNRGASRRTLLARAARVCKLISRHACALLRLASTLALYMLAHFNDSRVHSRFTRKSGLTGSRHTMIPALAGNTADAQ